MSNLTEIKGGFIVGVALALSCLEGADIAGLRHQWLLCILALSGTAASVAGLWFNLSSAHKVGVIEGIERAHAAVQEQLTKPLELSDRLVDHD